MADVGDDDQNSAGNMSGPKTPDAVLGVVLVDRRDEPELLCEATRSTASGNVYGCDDIYIPRHNVEPRTEHGTLKETIEK